MLPVMMNALVALGLAILAAQNAEEASAVLQRATETTRKQKGDRGTTDLAFVDGKGRPIQLSPEMKKTIEALKGK